MTGRERLSRQKVWLLALVGGAIVLIVAGVAGLPLLAAAGAPGPATSAVAVAGVVALMAAAVAGQQFLFRCPWCREKMGPLLSHRGFLRVDPKVRFCPFCGTDLDEPVDAAGWDDPVQ